MGKTMKTMDFDSLDNFWMWLESQITDKCSFLVEEKGFQIKKIEHAPTQLTIEYIKDDVEVGFWCGYGNRPEIFLKRGGVRLFTNELIKEAQLDHKNQITSSVFGKRTMKSDFEILLDYYVEILAECLQTIK